MLLHSIYNFLKKKKFQTLKNEVFYEKLHSTHKPVLLDVRSKFEFDREKIPGAMNMDITNPFFEKKVQHLNKDKAYFVYCQSGFRSRRACNKLIKMRFKEVYNLKGGINTWTERII